MTWDDRLTKGFVAGLIAGVIMDAVQTVLFFLQLNELTFFDWAGTVVFGYRPRTWTEYLLAIGAQILFTGTLGILFAYIIPTFTSKNIILKGWLFGLVSWFVLNAIVVLFKVSDLLPRRLDTATTDAIAVSLYGIILAYLFNRLNQKIRS